MPLLLMTIIVVCLNTRGGQRRPSDLGRTHSCRGGLGCTRTNSPQKVSSSPTHGGRHREEESEAPGLGAGRTLRIAAQEEEAREKIGCTRGAAKEAQNLDLLADDDASKEEDKDQGGAKGRPRRARRVVVGRHLRQPRR